MTDPARLLSLLQLTDSGFPTGAFAFSHGLEGLVAAGLVKDEDAVHEFIAVHLREGFARLECPAMSHAWRAAQAQDLERLVALDELVNALKPVPAFRSGSARTGRRLLESAAGVLAGPVLSAYRETVLVGRTPGHHAIAFAVVMAAAGQDEGTAALALGVGIVNGLAAAAVRLGVIGQVAAQRIIAATHEPIAAAAARGRQLAADDMGGFLPMIDVAGLAQSRLSGRVFAS